MSLEETLAGKLACFCCGQTEGDTYEVVCYGLELLLETVCKCVCLLLVAALLHKLKICIALLLCFCPLRAQMGGIHCKTNAGCTGVMFLLLFAVLFLARLHIPKYVLPLLFLVCLLVCILFAPSATAVNPIVDKKIRRRKKCLAAGIAAALFILAQFSVFSFAVPGLCVSFAAETVSVLLLEAVKKYKYLHHK